MSTSFSAKAGSCERLKLRARCGWSWCASQMRWHRPQRDACGLVTLMDRAQRLGDLAFQSRQR
jgi:hypothetical protein